MGSVYLAEREQEFRQRVAIKLVRQSIPDPEISRRFVIERQTLAVLNHPNIVKLLNGGTTEDNLPYLVVDYIEGVRIDAYCDEQRLSSNGRLRIFLKVCEAVHAAHQSLVVHCDLKPTNILVTVAGEPMLLDFGIAKLLDPASFGIGEAFAVTRHRAFTPEYASPEQLRGSPVTTATDIYALGVILYRLLTGRSPYRIASSDSLADWVRSVCDEEAEPPSSAVRRTRTPTPSAPDGAHPGGNPIVLDRRLRGDVDAIVLKALSKDPRERYASAGQFADDIRACLEGRPVQACRRTRAYILRKFIGRHKIAVGAASALLLSTILGIAGTVRESYIAGRRFDDVRQLAHVFLFDVHDAILDLPGSTPARALIAKTGTEYLNRLALDAAGDAALQRELAAGFIKIGDVQGNPFESNLGHTTEAIENYRRALAIADRVSARNPRDVAADRLLAQSHRQLAAVLPFQGQLDEALQHADAALDLYRGICAADRGDVEAKLDYATARSARGDILGGIQSGNLHRIAEATDEYERSTVLIPSLPPSHRLAPRAFRLGIVNAMRLADFRINRGDAAGALGAYQDALRSVRDFKGPKLAGIETNLLNKIGYAQTMLDNNPAALAAYNGAIDVNSSALTSDPSNERARTNLIASLKNKGDLLFYNLHDYTGALECYQRTAGMLEIQMNTDSSNLVWKQRLSETLTYIASCLVRTHNTGQARTSAQRGLEMAKQIADRPGSDAGQNYNYAWLAVTVEPDDLQNPAAALPYARKAVQLYHEQDPFSVHLLAQALAGTGNFKDAVSTEQKAIALMPAPRDGQPASGLQKIAQSALEEYRERVNSPSGGSIAK